MTVTPDVRSPVQPGEPAPDFTLPVAQGEGLVSLADYRGRSPVLLALFRGLYCPFCRRAIAQLGVTAETLKGLGVDTLAVVATNVDNARLYFRFRPARVRLAADSDLITHRAYGLPRPPATPELMAAMQRTRINPTGELAEPLPIPEATAVIDKLDGYTPSEVDRRDAERQFPQLKGQFLIDRDGVVRWVNVEGAVDGVAGIGKFPTDEQLVEAAHLLR